MLASKASTSANKKYSGTPSKVFLYNLGGSRYIFGEHGMCNRAVEHNVATFSELSLVVCWLLASA